MMKVERTDKKAYWRNELDSLGIRPNRSNELNDKVELAALVENIKQGYYRDYISAYTYDE